VLGYYAAFAGAVTEAPAAPSASNYLSSSGDMLAI